jgi:hypothetical protein
VFGLALVCVTSFFVAALQTALREFVFFKIVLRLLAAGSARVRPRPCVGFFQALNLIVAIGIVFAALQTALREFVFFKIVLRLLAAGSGACPASPLKVPALSPWPLALCLEPLIVNQGHESNARARVEEQQ